MARQLNSFQKRVYPQIVAAVSQQIDEHGNTALAIENVARQNNASINNIRWIWYHYRKIFKHESGLN